MAGMESGTYFGPVRPITEDNDLYNYHASRAQGFQLPIGRRPQQPIFVQPSPIDEDANSKKYINAGLRFVSVVAENLLTYPFVVLRRQCQVHHCSRSYHVLPLSLIPVVIHLHQRQGISSLWKGIGSVLVVRGITLLVEDVISKVSPLPKEVNWNSSVKTWGQHFLLKCISLAIVTPLYSASLVETVQSKIASDEPNFLSIFWEGFGRLASWGRPQKGRMLPIWALVVPTVFFGVVKYYFSMIVREVALTVMHRNQRIVQSRRGALPRDFPAKEELQDIEVSASVFALVSSEIVFYPLETIVHRIHLQGTRTIIDNLDNGYAVIPILTNYVGVIDCYQTTLSDEGTLGLYKGFGALIFQFGAHYALLKITKFILTHIADILSPPLPTPPTPPPVLTLPPPPTQYVRPANHEPLVIPDLNYSNYHEFQRQLDENYKKYVNFDRLYPSS